MARKETLDIQALKCKTAEELITLLQRKLRHGQYIYRGTAEEYTWNGYEKTNQRDISSSIFRRYRKDKKSKKGDNTGIDFKDSLPVHHEARIIQDARSHYPARTSNKEILTDIRHFGGLTTLIDFSHDLMVALFFACQEKGGEAGQLIILSYENLDILEHEYFSKDTGRVDRSPKVENEEKGLPNVSKKNDLPKRISLVEPAQTSTSRVRVIAQKSVFVHAPKGFIRHDLCKFITIKKEMKVGILKYLKHFHNIDRKNIYPDLHGFIDAQNHFAPALIALEMGNEYLVDGDYKRAIERYEDAIKSKPDYDEAYVRLALATALLGARNV